MPAIEVYEVGGDYFIEDGHHRVALARERRADFTDAEVTRLQTNYEIGPDVDVSRLVHTEQQRVLLEESGLGRARPDAVIEFTLLDGYTQLREIINAHGYDFAAGAASCRQPRKWPRTGTTRSIAPASMRYAARRCRSSTHHGAPPMPTCSSGSISSAGTCAGTTRRSTSTSLLSTRGR